MKSNGHIESFSETENAIDLSEQGETIDELQAASQHQSNSGISHSDSENSGSGSGNKTWNSIKSWISVLAVLVMLGFYVFDRSKESGSEYQATKDSIESLKNDVKDIKDSLKSGVIQVHITLDTNGVKTYHVSARQEITTPLGDDQESYAGGRRYQPNLEK